MAKHFIFRRKKSTVEVYSPPKLRGIKPLVRWEMIIEWFNPEKKFIYQRIGFKVDDSATFEQVMQKAQETVKLLSNIGKRRPDVDKRDYCRVVAIYAAHTFKDWESELALSNSDGKDFIRSALSKKAGDKAKDITPKEKKSKPISFVKVR